ncbi:hypothetical protein ACPV5O_24800 [Vibrio maritimus]|jgi:hypothetical protein|uniref:hypothetical protein n=1 Tax=Vibrio maritimus TaxID=990268 RepID=UPI0040690029
MKKKLLFGCIVGLLSFPVFWVYQSDFAETTVKTEHHLLLGEWQSDNGLSFEIVDEGLITQTGLLRVAFTRDKERLIGKSKFQEFTFEPMKGEEWTLKVKRTTFEDVPEKTYVISRPSTE